VFVPVEALFCRCRQQPAIVQDCGSAIVADAIQRKQIERNIFRIFAERRQTIENRLMPPGVTQA
jgi:hypothetical protein